MTTPVPNGSTVRRPLPALAFLLALCVLAALVWWRVLHRDNGSHAASKPTCTPSQAPKTLPEPAAVTVTVLNSTQRNGIAGVARTVLLRVGFRVPQQAQNDEKTLGGHGLVPGVAEIRYGPNAAGGAQLLGYYFPGASMVKTQSPDATVLVSLGAKFTAVNTPTKVAAALKADGITLVRTTGTPNDSATPRC